MGEWISALSSYHALAMHNIMYVKKSHSWFPTKLSSNQIFQGLILTIDSTKAWSLNKGKIFFFSLSLSHHFLPWVNISNVDNMLNYMTIKHYFRREHESFRILYWIQEIVLLTFNTCYAPILIIQFALTLYVFFDFSSLFILSLLRFSISFTLSLLFYPFTLSFCIAFNCFLVLFLLLYCNVPFSCFTIVSIIDCKLFVLA